MHSSLASENSSMLHTCIHYMPTAAALQRQKAASSYFTSKQVQRFGFAKRAMIRHMFRHYTRRGTMWDC